MHVRNTSTILVLAAVLLLAQTISVVDAAHKSANDPDPKKVAEAQDVADKKAKVEKNDEKRKAFAAYKDAFDAWKSAKDAYKTAKKSGVQTDIDAKKVILDVAKIAKDEALKKYNDTKNLNDTDRLKKQTNRSKQ